MALMTALAPLHQRAGARTTEFAGWQLPVSFTSTAEEHAAVRGGAGVFDVSHMMVTDVSGEAAGDWLRRLLCGDVATLARPGAGRYSCLLNTAGGIIDDLIVFRSPSGGESYRVITNAGTRERVRDWYREHLTAGVTLRERDDLSMIAVQGPTAPARVRDVLAGWLGAEFDVSALGGLRRFHALHGVGEARDVFVSRTGYTGEDGVEICLPHAQVGDLWEQLVAAGVVPCGLAVRDVLRLEAGMALHGSDMDETTRPQEAGLGWTVDLRDDHRAFIGRSEVDDAAPPARCVLRGLMLTEKGIPRAGCEVLAAGDGEEELVAGTVTSGTFSLSLELGIAFARLRAQTPIAQSTDAAAPCRVRVRRRVLGARLADTPFVRRGATASGA